jgi:large subunit ribosomal protein L18e
MASKHKNELVQQLIAELKRVGHEAAVWAAVAHDLERPTRHYPAVNLTKLARYTKQGDVVVVPGKVLGEGELSHSVTIAALGFSGSAAQKLAASKSQTLSIPELIKKDPKGKTVRIFA